MKLKGGMAVRSSLAKPCGPVERRGVLGRYADCIPPRAPGPSSMGPRLVHFGGGF